MAYLQKDADADARYITENIFQRKYSNVETIERVSEKLLAIGNRNQSSQGMAEEAAQMQNAFRIIHSIDKHELVTAEVCGDGDRKFWDRFMNSPLEAAIRLDGERFFKLWKLIKSRQPRLKLRDREGNRITK